MNHSNLISSSMWEGDSLAQDSLSTQKALQWRAFCELFKKVDSYLRDASENAIPSVFTDTCH